MFKNITLFIVLMVVCTGLGSILIGELAQRLAILIHGL